MDWVPKLQDSPYVLGGAGELEYSTWDKLGAQFKLENVIGSSLVSQRGVFTDDPDFDLSEYLEDKYPEHDEEQRFQLWRRLQDARSAAEANSLIETDKEYAQARAIRDTMGTWDSLWTGAIAGITDPIVLATSAIPVIRAGAGVAKTASQLSGLAAVEQAGIETILQDQQADRTLSESALNIGANAVLGGIFGGLGSKFYNNSRAFSSADGDAEQQAIIRGVLGAEEDTQLDWLAKAPGSRDELDAALAETDIVGRGWFRGIGATALNPIARLAANGASVTARKWGQMLNGHNFATKSNLNGGVGTAATTSVSTAVESVSGRFAAGSMDVLLPAYKQYTEINGRQPIKGWDNFLNEVGEHYRKYDPDNPNATPEMYRQVVKDLESNYKMYEDHLVRGGFFDDAFDEFYGNVDSLKKKIDDTKAKTATARDKVRNQEEIEVLETRLRLREAHNSRDPKATQKLIEGMHGERRYLTQAHNRELAIGRKDEWVQTMIKAETVWYERRIEQLRANGDTAEANVLAREWAKRQKNDYVGEMEGTYDELIKSNDSFNLGGFDGAAGQTKVRKLRIDQDTAKEFLKNNYMDLQNSHMSSVLPRMEMKNRGILPGSTEHRNMIAQIDREIDMKMQGATQKQIRKLEAERARIKNDLKNMEELLLHRNYDNVTQRQRDIAFVVTQFNATRQLGAMLIPSIGDVAGVIMKTGLPAIARAIKPVIKGMAGKELSTKEAGRMVGIVELVMASRMHALQNSAELGINQGTSARVMGRLSQTFYKATGILWWNQGMKEIAALGFGDGLISAARAPSRMSKTDKAWLLRDGWDAQKLSDLNELYKRFNLEGKVSGNSKVLDTGAIYRAWSEAPDAETRLSLERDVALADEYNLTLNKHADRSVVTPGSGDFPSFITKHPFLKLLGQYKGFGAASINKTTIPMTQGMMMGDANMAFGFMGLTVMGAGAYYLRQAMYDREITDNWQTMAYEGLLRGGALGLYSDGLAISQKVTNNWAGLGDAIGIETPSRYYARGFVTDVLGPTAGLLEDAGYFINAGASYAKGEELTQRDMAKGARMIPFNNIFYLRAVLENYDNDS